jgi:hypothetical protein
MWRSVNLEDLDRDSEGRAEGDAGPHPEGHKAVREQSVLNKTLSGAQKKRG